MTELVVQELEATPLIQEVKLRRKGKHIIHALRPYVYLHNNPTGTFHFEVLDSQDNLLKSHDFTASEVKTAWGKTDPYCHGFYTINLDNKLILKNGIYKFKISSTGYSFSISSWIGWVQEHENIKYDVLYTPIDDQQNPLTVEFWELKE